jgi:hypothetical protein|tara:strand:- start:5557 stop:6066 length:510 start_codon:yes stop_codon:yes gene_type:complete
MSDQNKQLKGNDLFPALDEQEKRLEKLGLFPVFLYPESIGDSGPVREALAYLRQNLWQDEGLACLLGNERDIGKYVVHNGTIAIVTGKRQVYVGCVNEKLIDELVRLGYGQDTEGTLEVPHSRDSKTFLRNITLPEINPNGSVTQAGDAYVNRILSLEQDLRDLHKRTA